MIPLAKATSNIQREPKLSDYFIIETFSNLIILHTKFDVHEIADVMEIHMVLVIVEDSHGAGHRIFETGALGQGGPMI